MSSPEELLAPPDSIFACQDIQEIQHEKMVAYAQALQYWTEKVDQLTRGKPHLLAESVKELQEEMRCYLSFSDEDVFEGMALLEETSIPPTKEAAPQSIRSTLAGTPVEEPTMKKRPSNQFPGWEKVLCPSQPMMAAGTDLSVERPKTKASRGKAGSNPSNQGTECDDHPAGVPPAH